MGAMIIFPLLFPRRNNSHGHAAADDFLTPLVNFRPLDDMNIEPLAVK